MFILMLGSVGKQSKDARETLRRLIGEGVFKFFTPILLWCDFLSIIDPFATNQNSQLVIITLGYGCSKVN